MRFTPPVVALFLLLDALPLAGQADPGTRDDAARLFRQLDGVWTCSGAFADGRSLAADLIFTLTETGALRYRHVDHAPSTYRQEAIWGYDGGTGQVASSVIASMGGDQPTSLALFVAEEWTATSIRIVARALLAEPWAPNRFTYTLGNDGSLRMVWEVERAGEWRMGDYLDCRRSR